MSDGAITKTWRELEKMYADKGLTRGQIASAEFAFFSGARSCFGVVVEASTGKTDDETRAILASVVKELSEYAERFNELMTNPAYLKTLSDEPGERS